MFQWCTKVVLQTKQLPTLVGTRNKQCSNIPNKLVCRQGLNFSIQRKYSSNFTPQSKEENNGVAHRFQTDFGCNPDTKSCVNYAYILIEKAKPNQGKMICSFLKTHYWPREPTIKQLWMNLDNEYIEFVNDRYSYCPKTDRFVAFEFLPRTGEYKLVGVLVASKKGPWHADEMENWGLGTTSPVVRTHILFLAHCFRSSDLCNKYKVPYIYDIEALAVDPEIGLHGVAQLLFRRAIALAVDLRHPLVQIICTNTYMESGCQRLKMTMDWSMDYEELIDYRGRQLFYPQFPQTTVSIFSRKYNLLQPIPHKCDEPLLYEAYMQMVNSVRPIRVKQNPCFTRESMGYGNKRERGQHFTSTCYKHPFSEGKPCPFKCYKKPMPV